MGRDSQMGRASRYIRAIKQSVQQAAQRKAEAPNADAAARSALGSPPSSGLAGRSVLVERRANTRRACRRPALSQPRVAPRGLVWETVLQDISSHGIGLVLTDRCRRGTILQVDLPCGRVPHSLLARVERTTAQADGWLHGCVLLSPLTAAELHELMTQ